MEMVFSLTAVVIVGDLLKGCGDRGGPAQVLEYLSFPTNPF